MNRNGDPNIWRLRPPKPSLGNGPVQHAAKREFMISDVISTGDVVQRAWRKRILIDGRKVWSGSYHHARRVLAAIADPVGRQRGRGRAWLWRLQDAGKYDYQRVFSILARADQL